MRSATAVLRLRQITRAAPPHALAAALSSVLLATAGTAPAFAGTSSVTCSFRSDRNVRVSMPESHDTADIRRESDGRITVNGGCSHPFGPPPDVWNTKKIMITGADGSQSVRIYLANGGFLPGSGSESGGSDEIEFSILLGAGNDGISIYGTAGPDWIRFGTKGSGGQIDLPIPRVNLNANESTGIDDDVVHLSVEYVVAYGLGGADALSGNGGAGTGGASTIRMSLYGYGGPDTLTGGVNDDYLRGDGGGDVMKGGKGDDTLSSVDGVAGNDDLTGGAGSDACTSDAGDAESGCDG